MDKKLLYKILSDKTFINLKFKKRLGYKLDFKDPKTFNEKLQWLKINDRNPLYTKCVDKYLVRDYVNEKIGEKYLNPLINVFEKDSKIDIGELLNIQKFVLKTTHDSGGVLVCKGNKTYTDLSDEVRCLKNRLEQNYYELSREYPYKNVKPRIICEELLEEENGDLLDYKLFCFNGKVKYIQVDIDRHLNHKRNIYDKDWNLTDIEYVYSNSSKIIKKPSKFEELKVIAEKLANNFPFCRVDFYIVNNKIFFGEMTFYPEAGFGKFRSYENDLMLGNLLRLE